jgi:predicted GH43/DUF377 family glycosyl hydrolase
MGMVRVRRSALRIAPAPSRVVAKPFRAGQEVSTNGKRLNTVLDRVLDLTEEQAKSTLQRTLARYSHRHRGFKRMLSGQYEAISHQLPAGIELSPARRSLMGAYFTHEYSFEAAALFNPSIVPAPDQSGLAAGELRFVMSLRAVGEGHISSVEFRTGIIDHEANVTLDPITPFACLGRRRPAVVSKRHFEAKLAELNVGERNKVVALVLEDLDDRFSKADLEAAIEGLSDKGVAPAVAFETTRVMHLLAESNYVLEFPAGSRLCERVIFPGAPTESHGLEDARFVRFEEEDSEPTYYATYTAYDGFEILPQLMATKSFRSFRMMTLRGKCAQNKGMALFPRRINGAFVMASRIDRESIQVMVSKRLQRWDQSTRLALPRQAWNLAQMGNCGSPIETEEGWLLLVHGVGPMREYALGALLLDLEDPTRVVGHLDEALMVPEEDEREGYVPNVLYSCGYIRHGDHLVIPYGAADARAGFAVVSMGELLGELCRT